MECRKCFTRSTKAATRVTIGKDEEPLMKNTVLLWTIILAFILFFCPRAYSATADRDNRRDMVEEEIWALEEAYFANLYKANYDGVLAIVHSQFLGWPVPCRNRLTEKKVLVS